MFVQLFMKILLASAVSFMTYFWYKGSNFASGFMDLPEGSKCETRGFPGTCVKMDGCSTLVVDIMHPHRNKTYPDICSYDGDTPIVCCTSCEADLAYYKNISNAVYAPSGKLFWKAGQKSWDKCLDYSAYASFYPRCWIKGGVRKEWDEESKCHYLVPWEYMAVGGMPADRDTYTHMALLGFGGDVETAQWLCGGSLISERFILTAGHCTGDAKLGPVSFAALGILKRSDPAELWQRYGISKIIKHPLYHPPSKYHDIALLQTDKPVAFNRAVFPACVLGFDGSEDEVFNDVTAIGWGALGHLQPMADALQVIKIRPLSVSTCMSQYPPHRLLKQGYNSTTQMCYGDRKRSVDTCQGDSGGPLQIEMSDLCMYFVMGVTSFGRACGTARGGGGVYTRVRHYVPWIESVVWP